MIDPNWWVNVDPKQSYSEKLPEQGDNPKYFNFVLEWPKKVVSKEQLLKFIQKSKNEKILPSQR